MVIIRTSATEVSIQAVSPELGAHAVKVLGVTRQAAPGWRLARRKDRQKAAPPLLRRRGRRRGNLNSYAWV